MVSTQWQRDQLLIESVGLSSFSCQLKLAGPNLVYEFRQAWLAGVPMPLAAGTLASLSAAVAANYGDRDLAELPKFLRETMLQNFG